ncbi:hypothetical protein H310_15409, partial [Aphanomyces invadans]
MTWQAAPSAWPTSADTAAAPALAGGQTAYNKSVPFGATNTIHMSDITFGVQDEVVLDFSVYSNVVPLQVTAFASQRVATYPTMYHTAVLSSAAWRLPSYLLPVNASRKVANLTLVIRMPDGFSGAAQFGVRFTALSANQVQTSWVTRAKMTWQSGTAAALPVLRPATSSSQLSVGAVQPTPLVPFNTTGTIELSNVVLGVSDTLTLDVAVHSPAVAKTVSVYIVQSVTNYPVTYFASAALTNGPYVVPAFALPGFQNASRRLSTVLIS